MLLQWVVLILVLLLLLMMSGPTLFDVLLKEMRNGGHKVWGLEKSNQRGGEGEHKPSGGHRLVLPGDPLVGHGRCGDLSGWCVRDGVNLTESIGLVLAQEFLPGVGFVRAQCPAQQQLLHRHPMHAVAGIIPRIGDVVGEGLGGEGGVHSTAVWGEFGVEVGEEGVLVCLLAWRGLLG